MSNIKDDIQKQSENIANNVGNFTIKALHASKKQIPCSIHIVGKACIISFASPEYTMPLAELIYTMPRQGKEVCYFECNGNIKSLLEVINLIDRILKKTDAKT